MRGLLQNISPRFSAAFSVLGHLNHRTGRWPALLERGHEVGKSNSVQADGLHYLNGMALTAETGWPGLLQRGWLMGRDCLCEIVE